MLKTSGKRIKSIVFSGIMVAFLSGCDLNQQSQEIATLQKALEKIQNQVVYLQILSVSIGGPYTVLNRYAEFTNGATEFFPVTTQLGTFYIAIGNISKYANGYVVSFNIGNINSATYKDAKFEVTFGEAYDLNKYINYSAWEASLHKKDVVISKQLSSGSWNKFDVILAPAREKDIAYIRATLTPNATVLSPDSDDSPPRY